MSVLPENILLATDGSEDAALAARVAADLTVKTGARLHVVHAWQVPASAYPAIPSVDLFERDAQELLSEELKRIGSTGVEVAETHLRMGNPVNEIVELAEELDRCLILIGSRGRGRLKRLVLGSVSEGVAHHASSPVLVVRDGPGAWPPTRVLVGEDASGDAARAGELGADIARLFGAKCLLVRAYPELPETDEEGRRVNPRIVEDGLRREERKLLTRAKDLEARAGIHPSVRIATGEAAEVILDAAQEGEAKNALVVVGSRGLGAIGRMRLGSVSTKLLHAAEGSVLVFPPSRGDA